MNYKTQRFLQHNWTLAEVSILITIIASLISGVSYGNRIIFRLESVEKEYARIQSKVLSMDSLRDGIRGDLDRHIKEDEVHTAIVDREILEIQEELNFRTSHPTTEWHRIAGSRR